MKLLIIRNLAVLICLLSLAQLVSAQENTTKGTETFWANLKTLCGKAFAGEIAADTATTDSAFANKALVMHVRSCAENQIKIPFFVGEDKSRTWVLTKQTNGLILLKHDHRHEDGTPDKVTMYGGLSTNTGFANKQIFPADQETTDLLPAAAGNVWWIDLTVGDFFSYNLRRIGTDRLFSVKFDLKNEIETPEAPWGWEGK